MLNIRLPKSRLFVVIVRKYLDYNTSRAQTSFSCGVLLSYCFRNDKRLQRNLCPLHKCVFLHTFHSSAHVVTVAQSQLGQSLPPKNLANIPLASINVLKDMIKCCIYTQRVFQAADPFNSDSAIKLWRWRPLAESIETTVIYTGSCRLPLNPVPAPCLYCRQILIV